MTPLRRVVSAAQLTSVDSHRPRDTSNNTHGAPHVQDVLAPRVPARPVAAACASTHLECLRAHLSAHHWEPMEAMFEADVPPPHRDAVAKAVATLGKAWFGHGHRPTFRVLVNLAKNDNLAVVQSMKNLLDEGLPSIHAYPILRALSGLNKQNVRTICDVLAVMLPNVPADSSEWDEFVWTLCEMDPAGRVRATHLAKRLGGSAHWPLSLWGDVIKACAAIAPRDEAAFVRVVARLPHLRIASWVFIVVMLAECPVFAWNSFLESVQAIAPVYGRELLAALRCLSRLPCEEWRGYTRALCGFFQSKLETQGWAGWDRAEICAAIASLPAHGREDIAAMVCASPDWEEPVYARQMRLLALVPAPARGNVLAFTNVLLERSLDQETALRLPQLAVRTPAVLLHLAAFSPNADFNTTAQCIARVLLRMPTPLANGWDRLPLGALWPLRDALVQNLDAAFPGVGAAIAAGRFDPKSDAHRRYSFFAALKHPHAERIASYAVGWANFTERMWNETCSVGEVRIQSGPSGTTLVPRILLANMHLAANRQAALYEVAEQFIDCMTAGERSSIARLLVVFDLRDDNAWARLAERALLAWPGFAFNMDELPIPDQATRAHLARITGRDHPETLLACLNRFGITDEATRVDLVRACRQRGCDVVPYIKNFELKPAAERKLLAESLLHNPDEIYALDPRDYPQFNRLSLEVRTNIPTEGVCDVEPATRALEQLIVEEGLDANHWAWIGNSLPSRMDGELLRQQVALIATAMFQVTYGIGARGGAWLCESGLLQDVFRMRAPHLRASMVGLVTAVARDSDARDFFMASDPLRLEERHPEARLLHALAQYARSRGIYTAPFEQALDTTFYGKFKDITKLRPLLAACKKVVETDELTVAEKSAIFATLTAANSGAEAEAASCHLSLLAELGSFAMLKDMSQGFLPLAEAVLERQLGALEVSDAAGKYSRTFGNARQPFGVWHYAARLRQLADPRAFAALTWFIADVLNDTHKTNRIQGLNNPHMALLNRQAAYAMTAWHGERISDLLATEAPQASTSQHRHLQALDTADPYHLLFCGTEVPKSCQRIDGDPRFTRGLLGYLLNGQTRLIAVVDKDTHRIVARALLRCLTDGTRPVLYREHVYGDASFTGAIDRLALDKARLMNAPLTAARCTRPGAEAYGRSLRSVGGRAPYEWVDGTGSIEDGSEFEIGNCDVLWMPEPLPAHAAAPHRRARSVPRRAWGLA